MDAYDVAIAGGGPAGAAAAITLARAGLRVLLADATAVRSFRVGEGLPPAARSLLDDLGVLDSIVADGHRISHGTISSWGAAGQQAKDFVFQLDGQGLQLDRVRFDATLRRAAAEVGVEVQDSARLVLADASVASAADLGGHCLHLRTPSAERSIYCRWLIDAGGAPAVLSRRLGATRRQADALLAFHMRLASDHGSDHSGSTLIEAVADGWWYSVLLPCGERLAAFLGEPDAAARRVLLSRDGLWAKLGETMELRRHCAAHGFRPLTQPAGADAASGRLDQFTGRNWIATGDAALSFDPLSSKGICNALYTGLRGGQAVLAALGGDSAAIVHYASHLTEIYRVYLLQLIQMYAAESRWRDQRFWAGRIAACTKAINAEIGG